MYLLHHRSQAPSDAAAAEITAPSPSLNNGGSRDHTAAQHTNAAHLWAKKHVVTVQRAMTHVPLPVLGGSAMGKSKVIAGSHFGIFT